MLLILPSMQMCLKCSLRTLTCRHSGPSKLTETGAIEAETHLEWLFKKKNKQQKTKFKLLNNVPLERKWGRLCAGVSPF